MLTSMAATSRKIGGRTLAIVDNCFSSVSRKACDIRSLRGEAPASPKGAVKPSRFRSPGPGRHRGELEHKVRVSALQIKGGLQAGARRPDDAKAAGIGHHLVGAEGIDELGRQCDAGDQMLVLLAVHQDRKRVVGAKVLRLGEPVIITISRADCGSGNRLRPR